MAKAKTAVNRARSTKSDFTVENFKNILADLQSGRWPLQRTQISDDMVTGLRMMINKSGLMSYHASYYVGDDRPFMKIGDANEDSPDYISLEDAREITKTIIALGEKGIDVQDGLHRRLIRELKKEGTRWRPK
jgi:hypothetical protein